MKKFFSLGILSTAILFSACNSGTESKTTDKDSTSTTTIATDANKEVASADIFYISDSTKKMGTAVFTQLADGQIKMDLNLNMKERADSNVAVHFHEHGDCGNKGEMAMGHWNPTNEAHGKWGTAPFHSGDIGNIMLDKDGNGTISITTDRWSIKDGDPNTIIGRGIIVHGGTDDYKTQPTGNSGPRVGCGQINKK